MSVTPDGRRLVSAGFEDKTLCVWDLESGRCLKTLEGRSDWVSSVSVTPDGRRAVSAGQDKNLCIWDIEGGELLEMYRGCAPFSSIALAHGGNTICAADEIGDSPVFFDLRGRGTRCNRIHSPVHRLLRAVAIRLIRGLRKEFRLQGGAAIAATQAIHGSLSPDNVSIPEIPPEAFDDPRLISECPQWNHARRLNATFVDMSDVHYEQVLRRSLEKSRHLKREDHEEVLAHLEALRVHLERAGKPD